MTLISLSHRLFFSQFRANSEFQRAAILAALCVLSFFAAVRCMAQAKPVPAPDVLVLSNGDALHGKLVSAANGKVTFHCDPLGDVSLGWDKIKELHTSGNFAVIESGEKEFKKKQAAAIPTGPIEVANKDVTVHAANVTTPVPLPVAKAQYVMDEATLNKEIHHRPGLFQGWSGAATAGATTVNATQHQYAISGAIDLVRVVPTVDWLARRNRTTIGFLGSLGKTTQPSYFIPATPTTPAGKPLWGFGYGLSYSTFKYGPVRLSSSTIKAGEPFTATVTVSNTATVGGDEVVEAYVKTPQEGGPIHSLVGFERVTIAPGNSKEVTLTIDPRSISSVDDQGNRSILAGKYALTLGGAQPQDTKAKSETSFTVTGSAPLPK